MLSISVDLPGVPLWQTLLDEFPEAKVVLVERDENKWINSAMNHTALEVYLFFQQDGNLVTR